MQPGKSARDDGLCSCKNLTPFQKVLWWYSGSKAYHKIVGTRGIACHLLSRQVGITAGQSLFFPFSGLPPTSQYFCLYNLQSKSRDQYSLAFSSSNYNTFAFLESFEEFKPHKLDTHFQRHWSRDPGRLPLFQILFLIIIGRSRKVLLKLQRSISE